MRSTSRPRPRPPARAPAARRRRPSRSRTTPSRPGRTSGSAATSGKPERRLVLVERLHGTSRALPSSSTRRVATTRPSTRARVSAVPPRRRPARRVLDVSTIATTSASSGSPCVAAVSAPPSRSSPSTRSPAPAPMASAATCSSSRSAAVRLHLDDDEQLRAVELGVLARGTTVCRAPGTGSCGWHLRGSRATVEDREDGEVDRDALQVLAQAGRAAAAVEHELARHGAVRVDRDVVPAAALRSHDQQPVRVERLESGGRR